ncbi:VWA domain-containing protein [Rhodococcus sp. BP-252]|uniref:vWA domain-containing protein n=1 Tax=unclassified Rhodococcus (in: high G+C Gram-positive bacteria) TaxID=192944 RepID=UPI001C9A55D3|nr:MULTISPECIES: VWA domain-containing protein [unclassified Rhodococcus (in: high G+C Gram-positive bacteria)]MBY6413087.1 VWA domain-containing protein [Rhodococcus sp. BP-320]MBY6417750.1 VWA domain-containing protein [Rhodococcus sp. BP-321]MBY6423900.1 VWA domain-containing protein [Rhodococcus sp. BP-324]MBY6427829.1 VWA domain-containing protein [Rhodococcus sp. BP-323]MBY6431828.1 VWA domain-containing protein [Rhodococcus sp. BP-322]
MRRKPKQLDESPSLFKPGVSGAVLVVDGRSRAGKATGENNPSAPGFTDETAEVIPLRDATEEESSADAATRARARKIAARLAVRRPRRDARARRGIGDLTSLRYRGGSDEIDMDRTLDILAANPLPEDDDIVVRERLHTKRSIVLVVDISGSMKGERVRTAAATVGALAGELNQDNLAVVAFWSDAAVLTRFGDPMTPLGILDTILRIPAQGLTNVQFALDTAAGLLRGTSSRDARVVLLSDCVHNAGPDPRYIAASIPRLDVLLDTSGENDLDLGRDLARLGHGRIRTVRTYRDVGPALSAFF